MNNTDIEKLLNEIKESNKSGDTPMIVMQCIILGIMVLKPILMYWIQAKYKAEPPHESIRKFEAKDSVNVSYNDDNDEYDKSNMV